MSQINVLPSYHESKLCSQGFFQRFWEGALGPFGLGISSAFNITVNWEKMSNETVSNYVQRMSRVACSHIILYHMTMNCKKEHLGERKLNNY